MSQLWNGSSTTVSVYFQNNTPFCKSVVLTRILESEEEREKAAQNWFSKRLNVLSKDQKNELAGDNIATLAKLAK